MIHDFIYAHQHVTVSGTWLVVIVPPEQFERAQVRFAGALVGASVFGGRTMALPGGGKLSLAKSSDPVFVPKGVPFDMMHIGWGGNVKSTEGIKKWQKAARSLVDPTF